MNAKNGGNEIGEISRNSNNAGKFINEAERFAQEICKTTDLGLNRFRLTHQDIFNKIGGLTIKTHHLLAYEIVHSKTVTIDEIKSLLSDSNIDSNIRMELVLALYLKGIKIDKKTFLSIKSKLIDISELDDGVIRADSSSSYKQTLLMFKDGKIVKGFLENIEKDPDLEGGFFYKVSGYKKIKSSGIIVQ